jgi:hypothetical protein
VTLTTRLKTRFRADFISLDLNFEHLEKRSAVSFRARENDIYKVSTKGERMSQKDREDSGDMQGRPEKSGGVTRRSFLRHLGAAGIAAAALPGARGEEMKAEEKAVDSLTPIAGAVPVTLSAREFEYYRHKKGMRSRTMRSLHGSRKRTTCEFVLDTSCHA